MTYKPTTSKYEGVTHIYYIVYSEPQKYRGGVEHERKRAKRFYVSGRLLTHSKRVGSFMNKLGGRTIGVKVVYKNPVTKHKSKSKFGEAISVKGYRSTITEIVPLSLPIHHKISITNIKPSYALDVD